MCWQFLAELISSLISGSDSREVMQTCMIETDNYSYQLSANCQEPLCFVSDTKANVQMMCMSA